MLSVLWPNPCPARTQEAFWGPELNWLPGKARRVSHREVWLGIGGPRDGVGHGALGGLYPSCLEFHRDRDLEVHPGAS